MKRSEESTSSQNTAKRPRGDIQAREPLYFRDCDLRIDEYDYHVVKYIAGGIESEEMNEDDKRSIAQKVSEIVTLDSNFRVTGLEVKFLRRPLPYSICNLDLLSNLTVHFSEFDEFPENLTELPNLKKMDFFDISLVNSFPAALGSMTSLEDVRLDELLELEAIPDSLCDLPNLKCLHLKNLAQITSLPSALRQLPLETLDITGTPITSLPPGFDSMPLKILKADFSVITHRLLESINGLTELHTLDMGEAPVDVNLQPFLVQQTQLEMVECHSSVLQFFPPSLFGAKSKLRRLRLRCILSNSTGIDDLHMDLSHLSRWWSLTWLTINFLCFQPAPHVVTLPHGMLLSLPNLKVFIVRPINFNRSSKMQLNVQELHGMVFLKELYLDECLLVTNPVQLAEEEESGIKPASTTRIHLPNLEHLSAANCNKNDLTALQRLHLPSLKKLRIVDTPVLDGSYLEILCSNWLHELKKLICFNFSRSNISSIPNLFLETFGLALECLALENTPFSNRDTETVEQDILQLMSHCPKLDCIGFRTSPKIEHMLCRAALRAALYEHEVVRSQWPLFLEIAVDVSATSPSIELDSLTMSEPDAIYTMLRESATKIFSE